MKSRGPVAPVVSSVPEAKQVWPLKRAAVVLARVTSDAHPNQRDVLNAVRRVVEAAVKELGAFRVLVPLIDRITERFRLDEGVCLACGEGLPAVPKPDHTHYCNRCSVIPDIADIPHPPEIFDGTF